MSKNKDRDEMIRSQINDIIEADIQLGVNEYIEERENQNKSGVGFVDKEDEKELKVNISQSEVDKLLKEYKRIKKSQRSNIGEVKKLGLLDKYGKPL
tara:strand:+ start:1006 stop:1296 length:291 start_codon:yes stop_codon:yes gene_type:complete